MPTCPQGHTSRTADYCDECGAPMNAGPAAPAPASTPVPASPPAPEGGWFTPDAAPCPECGELLTATFCEACGWGPGVAPAVPSSEVHRTETPPPVAPHQAGPVDPFAAGAAQEPAYSMPSSAPPAQGQDAQRSYAPPVSGAPAQPFGQEPAPGYAQPHEAPAQPFGQPPSEAPAQPFGQPYPAQAVWDVTADADYAYFERNCRINEIDPGTLQFPAYCPQRRFRLQGPQLLIGRRSASKGIAPELDLSGPPTDAAVSHAHALFVAQPDGRWAVVDVGSSNGTYINEATQPLAPNTPHVLNPGDRVHVGLWTTLTVVQS